MFAENDFAIELNLGFQSHYDFVKSIKDFNSSNHIDLILFFTEDIALCYQRADIRYQSGLHYVSPATIKEMYDNTFLLLKKHLGMFSRILAINVTAFEIPKICLEFDGATGAMTVQSKPGSWIENDLIPLLK